MKFFDQPWIQFRSVKNKIHIFFRTSHIGSSALSYSPICISLGVDDLGLSGSLRGSNNSSAKDRIVSKWIFEELSSRFSHFAKYVCLVGGSLLERSITGKRSHCLFYLLKPHETSSIIQWLASEQRCSHWEKIANIKRSCWYHRLRPLSNAFLPHNYSSQPLYR